MHLPLRIDLPDKWPGRAAVKPALVLMRTTGHWNDWLDRYARSGTWGQKHQYQAFRNMYYEELTGLHPDGARRVGK